PIATETVRYLGFISPKRCAARDAIKLHPRGRDCFVALRAPRNDGGCLPVTSSTSLRAKQSNLAACAEPTFVMADHDGGEARLITHLQHIVERSEIHDDQVLNLTRWISLPRRPTHHSGLMLAARMTFAHLSC